MTTPTETHRKAVPAWKVGLMILTAPFGLGLCILFFVLLLALAIIMSPIVALIVVHRKISGWFDKQFAMFSVAGPPEDPTLDSERYPRTVTTDEGMRSLFVGSMPMSVRIRGTAFRYHSRKYFFSGEEFHMNFVNDDRKLNARERFAGPGLNCGHYFTFTAESALQERSHYGPTSGTHALLKIRGEIDNILDLTTARHIRNLCRPVDPRDFLYNLASLPNGGSQTSFDIGKEACDMGYNGIIFYSARTMDPQDRDFLDKGGSDFATDPHVLLMSYRYDRLCLVIFSGAHLVRSIEKYSFGGAVYEKNLFFGRPVDEIQRLQHPTMNEPAVAVKSDTTP